MFLRKEVKPRQKSKLQTPQFTNYVLRITFQPFNQVKEAVMRRAVLIRVAALACMAWLVAMFGTGSAQEWVKLREEGANFYDIQRSFYKYFEGKKIEKGSGWTQFKRWEAEMEPLVYPSGILPDPDIEARAIRQYLQKKGALMKGAATLASVPTAIQAANWEPLGPETWQSANSGTTTPGNGRISGIAFHPTDPNTIFLGTPGGGLWRTTDGGMNWLPPTTDNLPVLGVGDIVIDPNNTNIMYIATGDYEQSSGKSVGVLRSINGGQSWNTTDLTFQVSESRNINRLIMHPTDSNILLPRLLTTSGKLRTAARVGRKRSSSVRLPSTPKI
jgi:hypothetical protein